MVGSPVLKVSSALSVAAFLLIISSASAIVCTAEQSEKCIGIAWCDYLGNDAVNTTGFQCGCFDGLFGSGYTQQYIDEQGLDAVAGCNSEAAVVRLSFLVNDAWDALLNPPPYTAAGPRLTPTEFSSVRTWLIDEVFSGATNAYLETSGFVYSFDKVDDCGGEEGTTWFTANLIFEDLDAADAYLTANLNSNISDQAQSPLQGPVPPFSTVASYAGVSLQYSADVGNGVNVVGTLAAAPRVYTWVAGTTEDPITVMPTGMVVDSVDFKHDCLTAGCWVVDITYTRGENNANVFYLPRTHNSDTLSYDFDYTTDTRVHMTYTQGDSVNADVSWTVDETFQPSNFPCQNDGYSFDADEDEAIQRQVSACCIPEFVENYRPLSKFAVDATFGDDGWDYLTLKAQCEADFDNAPVMSLANLFCSALSGQFHDPPGFAGQYSTGTHEYDYDTQNMETSKVEYMGVIDPYLGIFKARFYLDEVELRRYGGQLSGTVSVEHTVDFFVGLANFRPTNLKYFDMAATQTNIHVEKTDYFTVATHGQNDYTFLRYINLRLIEVYDQDLDNTDDLATQTFFRTTPSYKTQYVQVTFTLGSVYEKKPGFDIIPIDSVRIGRGTFAAGAQFAHACLDWQNPGEGELGLNSTDKAAFQEQIDQSCGPQSVMCKSPDSIPDSFVAYNVPAFDKTPGEMGYFREPQADLSNNIFIDMVVQVQNTEVMAGGGSTGNITKTTLRAQIPHVDGGVNIFCDAVGAKTDLKDVADVTIILGSAGTEDEFSRLRILTEQASSTLSPKASERIDSDSIEAALLTIIILGNESYFRQPFGHDGSAANDFGLELEDVITIHVMEDNDPDGSGTNLDAFDPALVAGKILNLLNTPGEELFDTNNELQTGGYRLNGAFEFEIDRANNRAKLNPTSALTESEATGGPGCAFAASRPATGTAGVIPTSCIIRRDISGRNCNVLQPGAGSVTASEINHCDDASCDAATLSGPSVTATGGSCSPSLSGAAFMETLLGENQYARELGTNHTRMIAQTYLLNDRSRRAWFINPGYEWTATQTGGLSRFQITSKLFMFALVGMNEGRGEDILIRRRFLLQSTGDGSTTTSTTITDTGATPMSVLAQANGVEEADIAWFRMEVALTEEEACLTDAELKESLRSTVEEAVEAEGASSNVLTTQLHDVKREMNGVACRRRKLGRNMLSYTDATATLNAYVVFETEAAAADRYINVEKMEEQFADRLLSIAPANIVAEDLDCVSCGGSAGSETDDDNEPGNQWSGGVVDVPASAPSLSVLSSTLVLCVGSVLAFSRK